MAETKVRIVCIHLSTSELLRIGAAARASAMRISPWVRHEALRAADGISQPPSRLEAPPPRRSPAKLTRRVHGRLTEEEFEAVQERALACKLPVSGFIRRSVLGHKLVARRPLLRSAIVAVHRASANLNQVVQLANSGAPVTPDLMLAVTEALEQIHVLRDAFLRADAANGGTERAR